MTPSLDGPAPAPPCTSAGAKRTSPPRDGRNRGVPRVEAAREDAPEPEPEPARMERMACPCSSSSSARLASLVIDAAPESASGGGEALARAGDRACTSSDPDGGVPPADVPAEVTAPSIGCSSTSSSLAGGGDLDSLSTRLFCVSVLPSRSDVALEGTADCIGLSTDSLVLPVRLALAPPCPCPGPCP